MQACAADYALTSATADVKVEVTLRLSVYRQSLRPGIKSLETHDQEFFQLNL
jgi:hypothetical protein